MPRVDRILGFTLVIALLSMIPASSQSKPDRIVFLGDSITDGHTYPLMVQQALRDAGQPVPVIINAGIGGDTAKGMSERLDRDVLAHHPTLVTLSAGVNDAIQNVTLEDYSSSITSIADRLHAEKIPLVILTTSIFGAEHAKAERLSDQYNAWLRQFAAARHLKVARVNALFKRTRAEKGEASVMESDAVHPNWEGQRLIARAVLDALDCPGAGVPTILKLDVMPGILSPWKMRVASAEKPLNAEAVQEILRAGDESPNAWKKYALPEAAPQKDPWHEQERQRGFALSLEKLVGEGNRFEGLTFLTNPTDTPKAMVFTIGAQLQSVWLNGEQIYRHTKWRGWHAGREAVVANLKPGINSVIIETGSQFFLSVTENEQ